jgi:hypothetical protein
MGFQLEETSTDYVFKMPKSLISAEDAESLFLNFRYQMIGKLNEATEEDVLMLVKESKGAGVKKNRDWLKEVPGFEKLL